MRLCSVPLALLPLYFLIAKADTSANATASPASSEAFPSTGNRSDTLISEPSKARDEERAPGIEDVRGKNKFTALLSKSVQALWKRDTKSQLEVKAAWWRIENVDPHSVYNNLMLNQIDENILSNPSFHVWFKYVKRYNADHPNGQVSIVEKLLTKYNERKLAMMLQQAKEEGDTLTKNIGTTLQNEQMSNWKNDMSPQEIYSLLQSDRKRGLLTGREYNIWSTYFSKLNPDESTSEFDQLYRTFQDAGLSSLLIAAKRLPATSEQARALHAELRAVWLSKGIEPKLVFEYLMLNEKPKRLLARPEMKIWEKYAKDYNKKTGNAVDYNEIFGSYYDADAMKTIIRTARTDDETKLATKLAPPQA